MIVGIGATILEPGSRVFFRYQGSQQPALLFYDAALLIPAPSPIAADAHGQIPALWAAPDSDPIYAVIPALLR